MKLREASFPKACKLVALDLRKLAGLPPRPLPSATLDGLSVAFDAADGLPAGLGKVGAMNPFKEAVVVVVFLVIFLAPLAVAAAPVVIYRAPWAVSGPLYGAMLLSSLWPTRYSPACQTQWLASWVLEYFSTVLVWEASFDGTEHYHRSCLLYTVPHGVMPVGSFMTHMVVERVFGFEAHGYAASVLFRLPFVRQLVTWMGCIHADRKSISAVLKKPQQGSGGFLDGIAGMFASADKDTETFCLGKRTGAFRLALQHGSVMIGGYCFGTTDVMSAWYDPYGVLKTLSSKLRMSLLVPIGRWGLPVPRRTPLLILCVERTVLLLPLLLLLRLLPLLLRRLLPLLLRRLRRLRRVPR